MQAAGGSDNLLNPECWGDDSGVYPPFTSEVQLLAGQMESALAHATMGQDTEYLIGRAPYERKDFFIGLPMGEGKESKKFTLPLSEADVKELIGHAQHAEIAHFGHGSQVDLTKRKTWGLKDITLPPEFMNFNAPGVLEYIRCTMAPTASRFTAEFYQLLIYEPGDFFAPHVDSQYSRQHVATLAVHIPYEHKGGSLTIGQWNREIDFSTMVTSAENEYNWVAWHSSVVHSVRPVISGYRIVLIYRLFRDSEVKTLEYASEELKALAFKLVASSAASTCPPAGVVQPKGMVVMLKHRYSVACLRGTDSEERKQEEAGDKKEHEPLLTGSDALVYQLVKGWGYPVTCQVLHEHRYGLMGKIQKKSGPYQKDCCWISDVDELDFSQGGYDEYKPPMPHRFGPNVLFISTVEPIDDDYESEWKDDPVHKTEYTYGNWDCGSDYYYHHAGIVVNLPTAAWARWLRRRPVVLAAYDANPNILKSLRLHSVELLKHVARYML